MSNITPESVLKELVVLFPIIYTALDNGVFKVKEFFNGQEHEQDKDIDRYFAPNMVRFYAVRHLRRAGQDAYIDDNELSLASVANNGMHINYGRYQIKVLKSNQGSLPVPGHSRTRQVFYDQPFLAYYDNQDDSSSIINLLLLWNVKNQYNGLDVLSLACPKSGGTTRDSVDHHFHCSIPTKLLYGEYSVNDVITPNDIFDLPLGDVSLDETGTNE